ncbi:hypothetical protein [Nocardioides sp. GY 10127]|uniref:hypothetical protein n=1 Tax=Nocardioides sp. GY 10127 TaxID=2569762 RepID=UPI0010A8A993|nr:hypothetical protein [Nocardioides sp. GY 10127]TIC79115.1 hypothetical protein E8D37_18310 [Nocardioides sp. GY 10127]
MTRALLDAGAAVAVNAPTPAAVRVCLDGSRRRGLVGVPGNATRPAQADQVVRDAVSALGGLDLVVSLGSGPGGRAVEGLPPEAVEAVASAAEPFLADPASCVLLLASGEIPSGEPGGLAPRTRDALALVRAAVLALSTHPDRGASAAGSSALDVAG